MGIILSKIPPNTKVAVLSVVGAFRSGKSFLLTFFLRYLRHGNPDNISDSWMTMSGDNMDEGNVSGSEADISVKSSGFAWSGGQERQTTGMWMWSEPFFRKVASYPEEIAILLMDTQGMFDNETTMSLTARIFGLSTLISSYQIYNVDKRIQEDNLQHLALFSEYGRLALGDDDSSSNSMGEGDASDIVAGAEDTHNKDSDDSTKSSDEASSPAKLSRKPFQ
ncbi:atl, partial [Symbiodinium microadriaticum]